MDEKKTYLINIESNLKKYAEEAAEAKKRVDELKASQQQLTESGQASAAEIEAGNGKLKNAQEEYRKAQKMVQLAIAATKSETGSRKQLDEILKLQMQSLGKLGNAYVKDAQGIMRLNPLYIEQRKRIAETKDAIIKYDQALNDGRTNVGRYGETVKAAFSSAGKSILSIIGPAALAAAAIKGIKDAFFSTDEGMGFLKRWGEMTKTFFYGVTHEHGSNDIALAKEAAAELERIRIEERKEMVKNAKLQTEIKLLRNEAAKSNVTEAQKLELLTQAESKEDQIIENKKNHLIEEIRAMQQLWSTRKEDGTLMDEIAAKRVELETILGEKSLRIAAKIATLEDKKKEDQEKTLEDRKKYNIEADKENQDFIDKEIERIDDEAKKKDEETERDFQRFSDYWDKVDALQNARKKIDAAAGFEYQRMKAGDNVDTLQTILDLEYGFMLKSVEYKNATDNQKLLIDQQYTENSRQLSLLRMDQQTQELNLTADIMGSMEGLFGKQTIAAKALSVAQALISTYTAGVKAMAELPLGSGPVLRFLTLASVIAAGLLQVKNILAVEIPGGGGGGGSAHVPDAISTSVLAQRAYAPPVGASFLTQPQLTQSQLNAVPNFGDLPTEIAIALGGEFKKLPVPVVTVEDINAKQSSVDKIKVRANI